MEPNVAEAMRILDEWDKEKERRGAVRAREKGFSSYAEYEKHFEEQFHQAHVKYEKRMDEKCALLGKTREELHMEDPQRYIPDDGGEAECDCEGEQPVLFLRAISSNNVVDHLIPFFCPKSLVDYQSQDAPELMDYLACQKRIRIEDLEINQGDGSRRLDQDMLEKAWVLDSQQDLRDVPFWAKADPVVRQILDSRSPSPPVQLRHPTNRLPSPISPQSSDLKMAENGTTMTVACNSLTSTEENYHVRKPSSTSSPRNHHPSFQEKPQQDSKAKYNSKPQSKRNSRTKSIPSSGKKKVNTTAKIQKNIQKKPAMRTRSRNINCFYELGLDGVAMRQPKILR